MYLLLLTNSFEDLTEKLSKLYEERSGKFLTAIFNTEVSEEQIAATTAAAGKISPNVIVGIGGGKTLDTAKAVADHLKVPVIIIPTSASTDAPTSALSVVYKPNGEHSHARHYIRALILY